MTLQNVDLDTVSVDDSAIPDDIKEEFAGLMLVDRFMGIISVSAIVTASALYWCVFFQLAVQIEPMVNAYFGVGK